MPTTSPSKADLQDLLDSTADAIRDALDPSLSREEVIQQLQQIDESLSDYGSDDYDADLDDEDEDGGENGET